MPIDRPLITKITGVINFMKILITGAYSRDIFSECMVAIVLGVISPNRRISRVRIPLANATIDPPKL